MQREVLLPCEIAYIHDTEQTGALSWSDFDRSLDRDLILLYVINENNRLKAELINAHSRIKELEAEYQKLFEQSNLGSDTSGIPSSKDWKRTGASEEPENPEESENSTDPNEGHNHKDNANNESPISVSNYLKGDDEEKKRPGGQKDHPPASMRVDGAREGEPVHHFPEKCKNCPQFERCIEEARFRQCYTGHGYDIEVTLVHREHQVFEATECPYDGSKIRDDIPGEVIGSRFYDINVQLHVLTWHHLFHGSYDRIALAAKEMFGLSLSAGTAYTIVRRASEKILVSSFMDALRFFILLFETVAGVDETSAPTGGRNAWVHTVVTKNVTLLSAHWRRGFDGTIYAGVVQFFTHTLISDCWAAYFNEAFKFKHAICDAHILRELVAAAYFRQQSWAIKMFDLLLEVFEAKRTAVEKGEKGLAQEYIDNIRKRYRQILAKGYIEIAGQTKGKTFSLLERLKKLEDAALAFAVDFRVDFTNNASEISLRDLKVALRVISQFKTMPGLVDYCIIQSFMDTCRKQGHNPFDMMKVLLSGGDIIEAVFGADKAAVIKQMIRLTKAFEKGDTNEINSIKAEMGAELTDELIAAASYGRFKAYNDPPPEKKTSSQAAPKDKMEAARESEKERLNKASQNSADHSDVKIRAGPMCA